jgi:hypothetical protein
MTTTIHDVSRVTSARSSEELAESHVNKTTWLATEDSEPPLGLGGIDPSTRSPSTVYPTRDIDSHSSTITQESALYQRSLPNGEKNRRRQQHILSSSATVMSPYHRSADIAGTSHAGQLHGLDTNIF